MAGAIATADHWEDFERKWKQTLEDYKLPYFHMKEYAHSKGVFADWQGKELKRKKLYDKLMRIMATTYILPFGSIIPMDIFRKLTPQQQEYFNDPYYFAFVSCVVIAADLMTPLQASEESMALVFSDHKDFRHLALQLYEHVIQAHPFGQKLDSPVFRDMRKLVPLQAADIVAYELHRECERIRYRPTDKPRWGWTELVKIGKRSANFQPFIIHDEATLAMHVRNSEEEWAKARAAMKRA